MCWFNTVAVTAILHEIMCDILKCLSTQGRLYMVHKIVSFQWLSSSVLPPSRWILVRDIHFLLHFQYHSLCGKSNTDIPKEFWKKRHKCAVQQSCQGSFVSVSLNSSYLSDIPISLSALTVQLTVHLCSAVKVFWSLTRNAVDPGLFWKSKMYLLWKALTQQTVITKQLG